MNTMTHSDWEQRYASGELPWDSGVPSKELVRVLDEEKIAPGRALEFGCGSGTNAVYLASRGFEVTGLDLSPTALELAKKKAAEAGVSVQFLEADVTRLEQPLGPFDFLFDRGCYHAVRRGNISGFLRTLREVSQAGTKFLLLAGNANERLEGGGPPQVYDHEIRIDLQALFDIHWIREFRFEVPAPPQGFLAWSCFMTRRAD